MTKSKQAGFTLVEMMVAVGIFVIVAFIVTTAFLTLADANRKAQNIRLVMDNLNFAIDSMALKMREGSYYQKLTDPSGVSFNDSENNSVSYTLQTRPDGNTGAIYCAGGSCGSEAPITAPQVDVKEFKVLVSSDKSKKAVLLISGTAGAGKTLTTFNIQTTVSER